MRSLIVAILLFAVLALTGCIILPIPTSESKLLAGKQVTEDQFSFLIPNVTTKDEVIQELGNPNVIWEDARIFSYNWEKRQGILFWAVGGYGGGAGGMTDIPKRYHLLIQFDEQDRVQHFERSVRALTQSYADFLKEWRIKSTVQPLSNPENGRNE